MSAPPIGRISRKPSASDSSRSSAEGARRLGRHEQRDQQDQQDAERGVDQMLAREDQRPAGDEALQFGEGDDRAGEGDRADRHAERHLDEAAAVDRAAHADAVGFRGR